jgi:hypothetical protein
LALEYLEDQLANDRPDQQLLDQLRWTREDLETFYRDWERMKREAAQQGTRGEAGRKQFDRALESLGLRPGGTELRGDQIPEDQVRGLREAFRSDPPPEYRDAWKAYLMGVGEGNE